MLGSNNVFAILLAAQLSLANFEMPVEGAHPEAGNLRVGIGKWSSDNGHQSAIARGAQPCNHPQGACAGNAQPSSQAPSSEGSTEHSASPSSEGSTEHPTTPSSEGSTENPSEPSLEGPSEGSSTNSPAGSSVDSSGYSAPASVGPAGSSSTNNSRVSSTDSVGASSEDSAAGSLGAYSTDVAGTLPGAASATAEATQVNSPESVDSTYMSITLQASTPTGSLPYDSGSGVVNPTPFAGNSSIVDHPVAQCSAIPTTSPDFADSTPIAGNSSVVDNPLTPGNSTVSPSFQTADAPFTAENSSFGNGTFAQTNGANSLGIHAVGTTAIAALTFAVSLLI